MAAQMPFWVTKWMTPMVQLLNATQINHQISIFSQIITHNGKQCLKSKGVWLRMCVCLCLCMHTFISPYCDCYVWTIHMTLSRQATNHWCAMEIVATQGANHSWNRNEKKTFDMKNYLWVHRFYLRCSGSLWISVVVDIFWSIGSFVPIAQHINEHFSTVCCVCVMLSLDWSSSSAKSGTYSN